MKIWVDVDARPRMIKEILFLAAERRQIPPTLVANQMLSCPPSKVIRAMQAPQEFDMADNRIVALTGQGHDTGAADDA